jgi:RNA polymerase sigma-70 factor (ECF subfamily)
VVTETPGAKANPDAAQADDPTSEADLPELMVRYQAGDSAAVEMLVRRLGPRLWRYFAALPRISRSETEDLLQECWIRIHRSRHTYRPEEPLLPWIFAIARHTKLDAWRRRRRRDAREILVATAPEAISIGAQTTAGSTDLDRLLKELPESQREVILMLKVSEMSLEEVARATSSTVGAVKQKAHRAYARLRQLIGKEGR